MFLCPLWAMSSRSLKHGIVPNLTGHGGKRKNDERLQQRIIRMVDKKPRTASKQTQADLQTQGTTVPAHTIRRHLNEMGRYGWKPRTEDPTADRHIKKPDWSLPNLTWGSQNHSGRTSCGPK